MIDIHVAYNKKIPGSISKIIQVSQKDIQGRSSKAKRCNELHFNQKLQKD